MYCMVSVCVLHGVYVILCMHVGMYMHVCVYACSVMECILRYVVYVCMYVSLYWSIPVTYLTTRYTPGNFRALLNNNCHIPYVSIHVDMFD